MHFCILTWAAKSVNATTPDPVSGVWRQANFAYVMYLLVLYMSMALSKTAVTYYEWNLSSVKLRQGGAKSSLWKKCFCQFVSYCGFKKPLMIQALYIISETWCKMRIKSYFYLNQIQYINACSWIQMKLQWSMPSPEASTKSSSYIWTLCGISSAPKPDSS